MIHLGDLHDAILLNLEVDWSGGELRCNFGVSLGETTSVRLLAHGLTLLKCPRAFPWGESDSVNHVRVDKAGGDSISLFIEMQSGDVIEASLLDVTLE